MQEVNVVYLTDNQLQSCLADIWKKNLSPTNSYLTSGREFKNETKQNQ